MRPHWKNAYCCLLGVLLAAGLRAQTTDPVPLREDEIIYSDVAGTAFLLKDWRPGIIRFSSGRIATQFKLRFDCIKNQLLLQFKGNSFSTESRVEEFVLFPHKENGADSMLFRKGFPQTSFANAETFYEVLVQGKQSLLCLHSKRVTHEGQFATKVVQRRIYDEVKYYLLKDNTLILLPEDRNEFGPQFDDAAKAIQEYIGQHGLKFRDKQDYIKLVQYYNSLPLR